MQLPSLLLFFRVVHLQSDVIYSIAATVVTASWLQLSKSGRAHLDQFIYLTSLLTAISLLTLVFPALLLVELTYILTEW